MSRRFYSRGHLVWFITVWALVVLLIVATVFGVVYGLAHG